MSKQIYIVWVWALLLLAASASAQIPGFMGRKTAIMANFYGWPGNVLTYFDESSRKYDGADVPFLKYDVVASLDRVLSRRHVVSLLVENYRLGSPRVYWSESFNTGNLGHSRLNVYGAGLAFKAFPFLKRGRIAPVGPYLRAEWRVNYIAGKHTPYPLTQTPNYHYYNRLLTVASLEPGFCGVIGERLLIDVGMRVRMLSFLLANSSGAAINGKEEDMRNLSSSDFVKFHLGLGVLLGK